MTDELPKPASLEEAKQWLKRRIEATRLSPFCTDGESTRMTQDVALFITGQPEEWREELKVYRETLQQERKERSDSQRFMN